MKINSLIAKTALAAAIAGASFAASAGVTTVADPAVVAIELFGDANNTNRDSDNTAITLPLIQFDATAAGNLGTAAAGDTVSIKLTLADTHAKWAFSYDDPTAWATQGIEVQVDVAGTATTIAPADIVAVDAGTVGNNTITIKITGKAWDLTKAITLKGFKVNKLKDTHMVLTGETKVNVEVRNETASPAEYDTSDNVTAIYSANGVVLNGARTTYVDGDSSDRGYIQVGDAQQSFTDWESVWGGLGSPTSAAHRDSFETNTDILYLGDLAIARGEKVISPTLTKKAGKEGGSLFDLSGGDRVTLSLTGDASLTQYGLTINTGGTVPCDSTSTIVATAAVDPTDNTKASITLPSGVIDLGRATTWNLCAKATTVGTERIEQLNKLVADVAVKYTNTTYGESRDNYDYKEVLRNGCQVTLFNLPNVNAGDKAMIRLTNTSDKDGQVNAFVYLEDGSRIDNNALLADNIPAHGTTTFSTNPNAGVYLGDKLPTFALETQGRARIVIQGAFPSCEALGLVRSPNGTLTNMTSTTNSSGTTAGTSNTSN